MEEIGYADMAMAVSLSVHILSQYPVVTWGNDEQKARWLPPMLAGEALGAFALTEPHAGSDAAALRLRAERVGRPTPRSAAYRLTGTKIWITNATEAEHYLVFATVDPAAGAKGITAFLVEKGTPGFRSGARSGRWASALTRRRSSSSTAASSRREPAGRGGPGLQDRALGAGRGPHLDRGGVRRAGPGGARCRGALPDRARRSAGVLSEQQGLRFMLAEMAQKVAAARALTRAAAEAKDRGEPFAEASSLAKWTASDAAMRVATDAVQLFGGERLLARVPASSA